MDTDPLTILIFTIPIFISLECIFVIIPALMNRLKVQRRFQSAPDIPKILHQPLSREDKNHMRSWYNGRSDSNNYIKRILEIDPTSGTFSPRQKQNSVRLRGARPVPLSLEPEPEKDWRSINKANWKVQKANDAIRDANRAIQEANEAIGRVNGADLAWMDSLVDIEKLRFVAKK